MARGRLAPGHARGGDVVPARGQDRARLAAAATALAVAALLGAYAGLAAVRWQAQAAGLAAASVSVLAFGLWRRRAEAIPPAVLLAGAAYGVSVASRDPDFDGASVAVAALLLLIAELAFWSLELATPVRYGQALLARRLALVAALGLGALATAALVGAAAARDAEQSLLVEGLGVAAAVLVVAVIARLAGRGARRGV